MQDKLVSIITALYNKELFIEQTIQCVLGQTYTEWELLIVDDGSTDGGHAIAERYAKQDKRILVLTQPNQGSAAARNNGMRQAQGRYIAFLDADDLWEPWFLEQQLKLMHTRQCQLVYGAHKRIDAHNEEVLQPFIPPVKITYKDLLRTCSITCMTGLYDTVPYGKIYLDEHFRCLRDDYIYWLHILRNCGVAYGNQGVIGSYRMLDSGLTSNKWRMIKPQFRVYRDVEKLGLIKSLFYLSCWAVNGVIKYWK
ncbi:MAG: glycosyltransferase [Paludibacteraceae bacterium]|nr:glycosyltransferase [Paludibacteraceae bacterium]